MGVVITLKMGVGILREFNILSKSELIMKNIKIKKSLSRVAVLYLLSTLFSVSFSADFKIVGLAGTNYYIGRIDAHKTPSKLPVSNILIYYEDGIIPCSSSDQCDQFEDKVSKYYSLMNRAEIIEYLEEVKSAWKACNQKFYGKCKYIGREFWNGDGAFLYKLALKRVKEKNLKKAVIFAQIAAKNEYTRAQHFLGVMSDPMFKEYAYPKDYKTAIYWYQKAASQNWPSSLVRLAQLYLNGDGVQKNESMFFELLSRAVKYKASDQSINAQFLLGKAFEEGIGTNIDYIQSLKWYEVAAKNGDVESMYSAGVFYNKGRGVPIDYCKAVKWYSMAADKGFSPAQHNLANRYWNGDCVEKDHKKAIKLFTKAMNNGYKLSKEALSQIYKR